MTKVKEGLDFDPGFAPYILAFRGTVEYLYFDINKFRNFSQKKVKFRQYHKKILEVFYNNLGFYAGCLMWAAYLKTQPEQEILSNPCFGQEYIEAENMEDTQYMLAFTDLYPKDMKYFMSEVFEFDSKFVQLIQVYESFLLQNKGFTETKNNTDLVLPQEIKTDNAAEFGSIIEKVLETGNLQELLEYLPKFM